MSLCSQSPSGVVSGGESCLTGGEGGVEIMLFGVRVKVDPMRKSVSMNNLSEYEPVDNSTGNPIGKEFLKPSEIGSGAAGYASADDAVRPPANGSAERKRGVPWTEEEHKLFLLGLQNVGKGDWRGISRNFVKTRTPTQVASHAQKYFLRQSNLNRRRRRSSLFDITTDSVNARPMEEVKSHQEGCQAQPLLPVPSNINGFSVMPFPMAVGTVLLSIPPGGNPMENSGLAQSGDGLNNSSAMLVNQVPFVPIMPTPSPGLVDFNLNEQVQPLSLRLSLSSGPEPLLTSGSPFQVMMPSFENGDSIISVA